MKTEKRLCPVCGDEIIGRVDKKFCTDQCRNTFNNERYSSDNVLALNTSGKTKVKRSKLLREGFDFNYFTGIYETQKGGRYHLIYDQGYLVLSDELYLLIKWEE
jgi:hypothetical protein